MPTLVAGIQVFKVI